MDRIFGCYGSLWDFECDAYALTRTALPILKRELCKGGKQSEPKLQLEYIMTRYSTGQSKGYPLGHWAFVTHKVRTFLLHIYRRAVYIEIWFASIYRVENS